LSPTGEATGPLLDRCCSTTCRSVSLSPPAERHASRSASTARWATRTATPKCGGCRRFLRSHGLTDLSSWTRRLSAACGCDNDLGLTAAVRAVFPQADLYLCEWHLKHALGRLLKKLSGDEPDHRVDFELLARTTGRGVYWALVLAAVHRRRAGLRLTPTQRLAAHHGKDPRSARCPDGTARHGQRRHQDRWRSASALCGAPQPPLAPLSGCADAMYPGPARAPTAQADLELIALLARPDRPH